MLRRKKLFNKHILRLETWKIGRKTELNWLLVFFSFNQLKCLVEKDKDFVKTKVNFGLPDRPSINDTKISSRNLRRWGWFAFSMREVVFAMAADKFRVVGFLKDRGFSCLLSGKLIYFDNSISFELPMSTWYHLRMRFFFLRKF